MEGTLLGDVHPNHHFIAKNGARIRNLRELYTSIQSMDDITFNHHVNDFKNDFHNWVRDIHKDNELASNLLAAKTKKEMAELLKARIEGLQNVKKEVKAIEANAAKVVKKAATKKVRERKTAAKVVKAPTQVPEPREESVPEEETEPEAEIVPEEETPEEEETVPDIEVMEAPGIVNEEKPLIERQMFRNITVGDFALGLIIGAIAGLIIANFI